MHKKEDVEQFEKLEQQLHSFLDEVSDLSHKKPNDPMNKFKLKFINGTIAKLNILLKEYRPFDDFEQFDVDTLPSNSDVVLMLSQYAGAALRFRTESSAYSKDEAEWRWKVGRKLTNIKTKAPSVFKYQPK